MAFQPNAFQPNAFQEGKIASGGGTAYTLTCNAGSYAITGQTANLSKGRTLTCSSGSYTATGQSSTITYTAYYVPPGTCGPILLENGEPLLLEDGSYLLSEVGACANVSTTTSGVRGGKRNVRPKFLEIDGKLIRVQNDEEVYRYLDRLKKSRMDKVKATAPKAAAKAIQGEYVEPPVITYQQADYSGLQAIYDRIAQINQDIELAYLLRVQREQQELDDEEALLLLL